MTTWERAVVGAYLARREHGPESTAYADALREMDLLRAKTGVLEAKRRKRIERAAGKASE